MLMLNVTPGELLDRLTILQLKSRNISDPAKCSVAIAERDAITQQVAEELPETFERSELAHAVQELYTVNARLWDVEDFLRSCERRRDFGDGFVAAARQVYRLNDTRSALKSKIDVLLGVESREAKSYVEY